MANADFWKKDQDEISKIGQETAALRNKIDKWNRFHKEAEEAGILIEMAIEENDEATLNEARRATERLKKEIKDLEFLALLGEPDDHRNAIVSINAGAGGTEAQDWVEMLLRMYTRWAEDKGMKVEIMDVLPGDEAGIKNVTFNVISPYAYGHLKSEHGVHRMVRISPFDATRRRHTTFSSVSVLPEIETNIEIQIDEKDLRIDTYRASGPGGQHVNKTSSAIRITHLPTNIVVQCQNEKSKTENSDRRR